MARLIAGHEIFRGLGGIKRIISNEARGYVELITNPITSDDVDSFSLFIKLEITTSPFNPQPEIKLDVSKRRWLSKLKENIFLRNSINGYIFSKNHGDRVFKFQLNPRKNTNTDKWELQPDDAFSVLQRELDLPLNISNAEQIIKGEASTDKCQVLLTYSNGMQEKNHDVDAGVPELDKLEAYRAVAKILEDKTNNGIKPFNSYSKVKLTHSSKDKEIIDAASKQINKPTLLNAVVEFLENSKITNFTPKYLKEMKDEEINNLLNKHFCFTLSEKGLKLFRFNNKNQDQSQDLQKLIEINQQSIKRLYPDQKPLLIIFYESQNRNILKLLTIIIEILWGNTLEIQLQQLPENTHGVKEASPGSNSKKQDRFKKRLDTWDSG